MAVNKVEITTENGVETLVDLTGDTVTPGKMARGTTAHAADGSLITGTATEVNIVQEKGTSTTDVMSQAAVTEELNQLSEEIVDLTNAVSDLGGVPDYVKTEAERVAQNVYSHQNANTFTFLAISDMHYHLNHANIKTSNVHAGQGMELVRKGVNIDFATCLGDNGWGSGISGDSNRATIDRGIAEIRGANKCLESAFRGIPNFRLRGNHDPLIYNYSFNGNMYLDSSKLFPLYDAYNRGVVFSAEKDRGYSYRDFDDWKLRVICMNTSDIQDLSLSDTTVDVYVSGKQGKWFAETIDLSTKEDAEDWSILILSHAPIDWGVNCIFLCDILKAYLDGGSVSVVRDGVTISYNYSGKNSATIIGNCHGHNHNYQTDNLRRLISGTSTTEPIAIKRFCIPNACDQRTNEKGENSKVEILDIEYGETTSYEKVVGTAQDTAFCVVTIDLVEKMIYADCYGAGYDRAISYVEEIEIFTVTKNLTNCSISNSAVQVVKGSTYTATVTANDGYTLDSVNVTMGGSTVAVTNGVINIANVTGDIVITAMASETVVEPSYTNQIPLSINADGSQFVGTNGEDGYKVGYRLSTSSGGETSQADHCATGYIHIPKTATVYIKDMTFDSSKSIWLIFDTSFAKVNGGTCVSAFTQDANGVWSKKFANNEGYIRISGKFGENPIITVNEPIE